jgi:hypothetical protein
MNQQTGLEQFAPATDLALDPGIRRAVLVLRSAGIVKLDRVHPRYDEICRELCSAKMVSRSKAAKE